MSNLFQSPTNWLLLIGLFMLVSIALFIRSILVSGRFKLRNLNGQRSDLATLRYISTLHSNDVSWPTHTNISRNSYRQSAGLIESVADDALGYLAHHGYVQRLYRLYDRGLHASPVGKPDIDTNLKGAILWSLVNIGNSLPTEFRIDYIWSILKAQYGADYLPTKQMLMVVVKGMVEREELMYVYRITPKGQNYLNKQNRKQSRKG